MSVEKIGEMTVCLNPGTEIEKDQSHQTVLVSQ